MGSVHSECPRIGTRNCGRWNAACFLSCDWTCAPALWRWRIFKPCCALQTDPNQSVLALRRALGPRKLHVTHSTKQILRVGRRIPSNLVILNNTAERVGVEFSLIT
jgi:hypothetical protein